MSKFHLPYERKRKSNENKFTKWKKLEGGGRRYFYEIKGRYGWKARYVKEVDASENTLKFYQEVYNEKGELIEVHEKYPKEHGHKKIKGVH